MDFDLLLSLAGVFFPSAIQGSTGYAEAGSKQQRLLVNNMKELSLDDIRNIYLKVLK